MSKKLGIDEEAERLVKCGFDVIPVGATDPSGEFNAKNPGLIKDWRTKRWSLVELIAAVNEDPRRGIGIRLSSTDIVDVEADTKEADAEAGSLFDHSAHTPTWQSIGANGHFPGKHRVFRLTTEQRQWLADNQKEGGFKSKDGIEVRCTGQSVVPPSGGRFWVTPPETVVAVMPDKQWEYLTRGLEQKGHDEVEGQTDTPGHDFCQRGDWREILEPHGWTFLNDEHVCRPGKSGSVSATIGRCTSGARGELLYIFSDSPEISPLEPRISYSKFEAKAILDHDGSFSDCARALRKEGFGKGVSAEDIFDEIEWDTPVEVVEDVEIVPLAIAPPDPPKIDNDFPILSDNHFDNVIGEYALDIRDHSNIDYQAVYLQALEMFGCLVGRNGWYTYNMGTRYLSDYLIVVGPTGAGKGTTFDAAKRLFKPVTGDDLFADIPDHQRAYNAINQGRFGSGEGLLVSLAARKADFEVAGLMLGDQYKHVIFISDQEASAAFAKMAIDNSVVNENLRQAWDFNTLSNTTKRESWIAPNPVMGIVWHIVPNDLNKLPADLLYGGFINRLKIVCCSKPPKPPRVRPGVDLESYKDWLGKIFAAINESREEITFNAAATKHMEEIEDWQHSLDGVVATTHERYAAHVERMACRLALLDNGRRVVSKRDVVHASAIQTIVYEHTERLIGRLRSGDVEKMFEQRIFEFIQDSTEPVKLSDITRFPCNGRTDLIEKRDAALAKMVREGRLHRGVSKPKKGRPVTFYQLASPSRGSLG